MGRIKQGERLLFGLTRFWAELVKMVKINVSGLIASVRACTSKHCRYTIRTIPTLTLRERAWKRKRDRKRVEWSSAYSNIQIHSFCIVYAIMKTNLIAPPLRPLSWRSFLPRCFGASNPVSTAIVYGLGFVPLDSQSTRSQAQVRTSIQA